MPDLGRRDFLKALGLAAGTPALLGACSAPDRRLVPYTTQPEDMVPGVATWYATTCRECPAGCGVLAKNREGRVIKLEGIPGHPVNGGRLCARGQASVQGIYNPDRFPGPLAKDRGGHLQSIPWPEAEDRLARKLAEIRAAGDRGRVVFITDLVNGSYKDFIDLWLSEYGSSEHCLFEPFAYESLRAANRICFGEDAIPTYRIEEADFLLALNTPVLETWLSNVDYARRFAAFRAPKGAVKNSFVFVGPRLSMTAANADEWIAVAPGDEVFVAAGLLKVLAGRSLPAQFDPSAAAWAKALTDAISMEAIASRTGIGEERFKALADRFAQAKRPLVLAEGLSVAAPHATEAAVAANLLCSLVPASLDLLDFGSPSALGAAAPASQLKEMSERMRAGEIDLVLIHGTNPLYWLPPAWKFGTALDSVPMVVSLATAVDETALAANLVLPSTSHLECWGDYSPRAGVRGIMQPVMGRMFDARHPAEVLMAAARKSGAGARFPWKDFYSFLRENWARKVLNRVPDLTPDQAWDAALMAGGVWSEPAPRAPRLSTDVTTFAFAPPEGPTPGAAGFHFTACASIKYFDGRSASRPLLQELPDPMTQLTWGTWIEMSFTDTQSLGIEPGAVLRVKSPHGTIEAPAYPMPHVPAGTLSVPFGQGHRSFGRFADLGHGNPMELLAGELDPASGGITREDFRVTVEKTGRRIPMAHTDGSFTQQGRELFQSVSFGDYRGEVAAGAHPELILPLPEGYDPHRDFYPPHEHVDYRWAMVVDLDRCIGCGACVVACYAENNVAIVGKEQILKGREMSWLRIQRTFHPERPGARWLPMLCQHCDNAPCESVCPIFAPHHNKEGLNNQVYNRCFGTRFCSQNCPYKVRRFNWFTFTRPEPLNWQLNPDVTVRQKGVMEKCSFCIQRITDAKVKARNKGRKVLDGDFTTACAQTCPTNALVFGNLKDPESRISKTIRDPRTYQVLMDLNTKPAVFYLKRLTLEA